MFNCVLNILKIRLMFGLLLVGVAEEEHIIRYNAGACLLIALLIGDLAIGNLSLDHGALPLLQVLQHRVA